MRRWPGAIRVVFTIILGSLGSGAIAVLALAVVNRSPEIRTRLEEEIDGGSMEQYLESSDEKKEILRWVARGAVRDSWSEVERVFADRCFLSQRRYDAKSRAVGRVRVCGSCCHSAASTCREDRVGLDGKVPGRAGESMPFVVEIR